MSEKFEAQEIPGAYHAGSRQLQDHFDCRRIADRLEQVTAHTAFTDDDRAFIESCPMFFLATANQEGWPDCSYKGGMPGFVRVLRVNGTLPFISNGYHWINRPEPILFISVQKKPHQRLTGLCHHTR